MTGHDPRIILHLDMDSFFAAIEVHRRPDLTGKPVIIGADPKEGMGRGVVATCSYEARAYGIRSAMPISQAFRLCPGAVYLVPDFPMYALVSARLMTALRTYGFRFQQVSIDEAFLDISTVKTYSAAKEMADQVKSGILTELGLSCSIGIAPTKIVAKIASDHKKPGGLTMVEPHEVQSFLSLLPVKKIPGIGIKTEGALHEMGIRTIGELAGSDIQTLAGRFGRWGVLMREVACGIDESEVEEHEGIKSVSRETTFQNDTGNRQDLLRTMETLVQDVHQSLIDGDLRFRTVTVKVRYGDFTTKTRARTVAHYTNDRITILTCALAMVRELLDDRKIRLLGLRLSSMEEGGARQATLHTFTLPPG